ncbi:MAG: hypothetical protein HGB15_09160 [Chlorobaculum sp.]|jgi:hypothetical protein|nr:hypothetical protein [Chlorobaculum sp.]
MTAKKEIIQAVETLPDNATTEEAMELLLIIAKVEKGLKQAVNGETASHMVVRGQISKWLK